MKWKDRNRKSEPDWAKSGQKDRKPRDAELDAIIKLLEGRKG